MSGGPRGAEMRRIVQRSIEDEAFRRRLVEDPKGTVEEELGTRLPEDVRVVAVEESADTIYLVLPSTSGAGSKGVELSDPQLESVAGGDDDIYSEDNWTCDPRGDARCREVIDE